MAAKRRFSAEQKLTILREYLENQVPVSELAKKNGITPTMIYQWKKQLFEGALQIFNHSKSKSAERRIKGLQEKLQDKDSLISELVSENVRLKKNLNGVG
jgi:transposase-like protein